MTHDGTIKHIPVKRVFDILFSIQAFILLFPLFLLLFLTVRLSSRGKAIYAQQRIGRGGKPFQCYKFRTMYADADARLHELLESCPSLKKEWQQTYKLRKDPRITPVGLFLRRSSLDELPQLWNVLKGDLSIVGPRPVVEEEVIKHLGIKAPKILSVRPGLTCIWQVSGRNDISYCRRVQLDEEYVDNQSFFLDIKLILKTFPRMLSGKGAY